MCAWNGNGKVGTVARRTGSINEEMEEGRKGNGMHFLDFIATKKIFGGCRLFRTLEAASHANLTVGQREPSC